MFLFFSEYLKYRHIIFLSTFQNLTQVLKEKNICLVDTSINCFLFLLCFILLLSSENAWLPFPRHAIPGCLLGGVGLIHQLSWVNVSGPPWNSCPEAAHSVLGTEHCHNWWSTCKHFSYIILSQRSPLSGHLSLDLGEEWLSFHGQRSDLGPQTWLTAKTITLSVISGNSSTHRK